MCNSSNKKKMNKMPACVKKEVDLEDVIISLLT